MPLKKIVGKELSLFFSSPIAYLFLGTFAIVTLFIFFWAESFFARNIADVRPMFEWMPILLIFLASTLTMRLWSEERRTGTLEHILTQPLPLWHFVLGKFCACLILLAAALFITLPLPLTVAFLGDLDWGPVFSGYLATFLLGAAYLSIGLFVSARCDNQIVSLISAVALCSLFYLPGSPSITNFFGNQAGEWLRLIGTGSRFESITRGVIDARDLYYYLSIVISFQALNIFVLERERWAAQGSARLHKFWHRLTALLIINALAANLWLGQTSLLRFDTTEGRQYSISDATESYLDRLQEPLLLRGYFSSETHPLLSPLVPQLEDLMREYEVAGNGNVRIEFVDPLNEQGIAEQASQQYGIEPVPFQIADRYQASIVNSYFDVLVQYGDEYQVLNFQDLIAIQGGGAGNDIDVRLRNPEYDLTSAIRSVMNSYQAGGNLFTTVRDKLSFTAYVSDESKLPETLAEFKKTVNDTVSTLAEQAGDRLTLEFIDPEAGGGQVATQIAEDYGFSPMATSILSTDSFYFYMTLSNAEQAVQIPLGDMSETDFKRNLDAAVKRFASGFTKTVAVVSPAGAASPMTMHAGGAAQMNQLRSFLRSEYNLQNEDLSDGSVSGEADLLLLLAPENLDEASVFAIDQYLMQGGTVVAATSPYKVNLNGNSLSLQKHNSGLEDWLTHLGINIQEQLVMDPRSAVFPVPVTRNIGGFSMQEWRTLDYPYFVDVRDDGLNKDNPVTSDLPQVTLAWSSPISVDEEKNANREVSVLLQSSENAWLSNSLSVTPQISQNGISQFQPQGDRGSRTLGLVVSGRFDSYFAGQESPLLAQSETADSDAAGDGNGQGPENAADTESEEKPSFGSVIEKSPQSSRIILISSNDFLDDRILQLLGVTNGSEYLNSMQMMANNIDWSLEDSGLLSIRSRDHFNRTLPALNQQQQMFWEYGNYALAGIALALIGLLQRRRRNKHSRQYSQIMIQS